MNEIQNLIDPDWGWLGSLAFAIGYLGWTAWKIYRENKIINLADKQGRKLTRYTTSKFKGVDITWEESNSFDVPDE